jgi:putative ABC transport system permease protein
MIIINIKHSLRSLKNNRLFTALNLCGFVLGIAASMILALYVYREYNVDKCFPNHENIYLLINAKDKSVPIDYDLAEMLKERFPEVEVAVALDYKVWSDTYLRNTSTDEYITGVGYGSTSNDFFRMFSIKTLIGNPQSPFADDNSVVLTVSTAQKLFGRLDVIGEEIDFSGWSKHFVSAVVEDMPQNSSFSKATFFINYNNDENRNRMNCNDGICWNLAPTYIQLASTANPDVFTETVNHFFPPAKGIDSLGLIPLDKTYLSTDLLAKETETGNPALAMVMLAITVAVLFLSVFNYLNFSLSKQFATLKGIGIRLVNGASFAQLRTLFLSEAILIVGIASLFALLLTFITLPFVQTQLLNVPLHFSELFSPLMLGAIFVILITIVAVSSLVPIYIISRFDFQILFGRGRTRMSKQRVKQFFTTIQMAVSIVLLVALITIYKQLGYARSYDLGFDKEHLLQIDFGPSSGSSRLFQEKVNRYAFVENSALSSGAPGNVNLMMGINEKDDAGENLNLIFQAILMDENFMATMGIELAEGREMLASDRGTSCYITKEAFKQTGWKTYEGKRFNNFDGYDIVGIANNFSMLSIHEKQEPIVLMMAKDDKRFGTLSVRLKPGKLAEQMAELENLWKETFPDQPFQYAFYDDVFDAFYRKEAQQAKGIVAFSVIALLITCMGLIGQVFQSCLTRRKEIGIRKIHGATVTDIIGLFGISYVKWFVASFIVAVPVSFYFMNQWLQNFAYRTPLSWWVYLVAFVAVGIITVCTVTFQTWRVANGNPVDAIKME